MAYQLEDNERQILTLIAESSYDIDPHAEIVDCLVVKGLIHRTANDTLLLTITAIDLLDSGQ